MYINVEYGENGLVTKCNICEFKANKIQIVRDHLWKVHLLCSKCQITFQSKEELKSHMKEQHDSKDFCDLCDYFSCNDRKLKKHGYLNHNICEFCKEVFKNKEDVQKHKSDVHGVEENSYSCIRCGKNFSQNRRLLFHIRHIHEDYKCKTCGKSFSQAGNLKRHIHTVHEGHKDHKCESCSKLFSSASYLKKHTHTIH